MLARSPLKSSTNVSSSSCCGSLRFFMRTTPILVSFTFLVALIPMLICVHPMLLQHRRSAALHAFRLDYALQMDTTVPAESVSSVSSATRLLKSEVDAAKEAAFRQQWTAFSMSEKERLDIAQLQLSAPIESTDASIPAAAPTTIESPTSSAAPTATSETHSPKANPDPPVAVVPSAEAPSVPPEPIQAIASTPVATVATAETVSLPTEPNYSHFRIAPEITMPPPLCAAGVRDKCVWSHANPSVYFRWTTSVQMGPLDPLDMTHSPPIQVPGVKVNIFHTDSCCESGITPQEKQPSAFFRVKIHGHALLSTDSPLEMPRDQRDVSVFVPLPDAGMHYVSVQLTLFNVSSPDCFTSQSYLGKDEDDEFTDPGVHSGRLVPHRHSGPGIERSDQIMVVIPPAPAADDIGSAEYKRDPRVQPYDSLPLCGSSNNGRLHGRWLRVVRATIVPASTPPEEAPKSLPDLEKETTSWIGAQRALFAQDLDVIPKELDRAPFVWRFFPYSCRIDYNLNMISVWSRLKWLSFYGDSNIRNLFKVACKIFAGQHVGEKNRELFHMDPPQSCLVPTNAKVAASSTTTAADQQFLFTYTSWFYAKHLSTDEKAAAASWVELCKYYKDLASMGPFYGFPQCEDHSVFPQWVQSLQGPGATYIGWGSHMPQIGGGSKGSEHVERVLLGDQALLQQAHLAVLQKKKENSYFKQHPTIFAMTTAVGVSEIPAKFGKQFHVRNNERISHTMESFTEAVRPFVPSALPPADLEQQMWTPVFDLFHPTLIAHEALRSDAIHYQMCVYEEQLRILTHFLHHSPNFRRKHPTHRLIVDSDAALTKAL